MSSGPDFEKDSVSYKVKGFYQKYCETLPHFVMVVQGYMGEILLETFGANQVLRIHTYSKQPRIIAKVIGGGKYRNRLLSIPLDFPTKLCVVKSSKKANKEQTLKEIMNHNKLPIDVRFGDGEITIGAQVKASNQISTLQLMEQFEEIYLLGNCINAGILDARQVAVPLYLPDLEVALITGIKGKTEQAWEGYREMMKEQVDAVCTFDKNYGNQDIAVYASESVQKDTMIAYVEPNLYANMREIFPQIKNEELYTNVDDVPGLCTQPKEQKISTFVSDDQLQKSKQPASSYPDVEYYSIPDDITTKNSSDMKDENKFNATNIHKSPPPVAPKPTNKSKVLDAPPPVPERLPNTHISIQALHENAAKNNIVIEPDITKKANTFTEKQSADVYESISNKSSRSSTEGDIDIEALTVEDVSHWLHELKLDKYVDNFVENCIDGTILKEIDEGLLKSEFCFSAIEAIRLMKFVREGHTPKHSTPKW